MDALGKQFREIFKSNDIKIGMTELAKVTGVSPSQLRYWERQGFIHSQQDQQNKNHHFSLMTAYQVRTIKFYLDQGYTLQVAVQKEHERRTLGKVFRYFITDRIQSIDQDDNGDGLVMLGKLDDDPTKEVYARVDQDGKTTLHLRPVQDD
ncbi:MerR family transcriptional regulator [uncultured Limosilactobacillus sp.]|uniref:MerR family transcriptional regulator n=1 Tax=uncultured Limosilactobacillus sp. TaxID=2837629 RepID=UPI0025978811|nr:MerR family transcriptional regulator [uncultured Limosilactobacillus sp.]